MKKLRKDRSAISEVIGALMLTLIVVIAASSFAVFVAEKQKVEQANQMLKDQKSQESLQVLFIRPFFNGTSYEKFNFTISSNHVGLSLINKISVNDFIVKNYTAYRSNNPENIDYTLGLKMNPRETIEIEIDVNDFWYYTDIAQNNAITLSLYTKLNNVFQKSFQPPTSLISITTQTLWNATAQNYTPYLVLDGSSSQQTGGGYITFWEWNMTDGFNYSVVSGQKIRYDFPSNGGSPITYTIQLTVKNNFGMIGISNTTYTN